MTVDNKSILIIYHENKLYVWVHHIICLLIEDKRSTFKNLKQQNALKFPTSLSQATL